mgnify:CR=1 FL=1
MTLRPRSDQRPVTVLRLVTHGTVEERIVQRARDKIYLMQRTMTARGGETVDKSEEQAAPSASEDDKTPATTNED